MNNKECTDAPAKWVWRVGDNAFGDWECVCSNCENHAPYTADGRVNLAPYCHNCGKEMKANV